MTHASYQPPDPDPFTLTAVRQGDRWIVSGYTNAPGDFASEYEAEIWIQAYEQGAWENQ